MEEDFVKRLPGSPEEVVWKTSWKSPGRLPGSRLEDFQEVQEVVWKTSWKSSGRLSGSRLVHYILDDQRTRDPRSHNTNDELVPPELRHDANVSCPASVLRAERPGDSTSLSLVLYRRKSQPVVSNPLHPPEPPDPPDPTITPQPPPSSSVNSSPPQSPSLFCARPSSISVQSPRSLPSPFRFHLSLHNKVSKLVPVWRSLADSWEVADASMLESPTPQGHVNQNRQPLPFVGLHQLDLPMSQPYKCWLSLMVSFPHRQRLTPQPAVRSQELEHQLECYLSSSAIRAFLVSQQDNFVDVSVLMWLAVLKPLSLQYTTFRSLGDWILDVDRLVGECFVATVLLNR
ncbi:hypothetical protein YC2023_055339 [Brassica napus]